jgi:hypothetical protein
MKKIGKGCLIILIIVIIIVTSLIVLAFKFILRSPEQHVGEVQTIKIGDYAYFGKYYNKPILWRIIDIDKDGDPMLYSEYILCLKAFDAAGAYHKVKFVSETGSNYWTDSNLRQWLNTSDKSIKWIQNSPSKENVYENAYDKEKGFLEDENFTSLERATIKSFNHKLILSDVNKEKKDGGDEWYYGPDFIDDVEKGYDNAYYMNVTDNVFLLSTVELKKYLYDRKWECRRRLTEEAAENGVLYNKNEKLESNSYWENWLITPDDSAGNSVYALSTEFRLDIKGMRLQNSLLGGLPHDGNIGVSPDLYLNKKAIEVKSGTGTKKNPYILDEVKVIK